MYELNRNNSEQVRDLFSFLQSLEKKHPFYTALYALCLHRSSWIKDVDIYFNEGGIGKGLHFTGRLLCLFNTEFTSYRLEANNP